MALYHINKNGMHKGTYNTLHGNTALITHILTKEGGTIKDIINPAYMEAFTIHKEEHKEEPYIFNGFITWIDKNLILFN
jgi:hypothetical protein